MEVFIALLEKGNFYEHPDINLIGAFGSRVMALDSVSEYVSIHCPGWALTGGDDNNRFKLLRTSKRGEHGDWDDYGYICIHKIPLDEMINVQTFGNSS